MTYQTALKPWAVYRLDARLRHVCVAKFRTRNDADSYLSLLRRLNPDFKYEVLFNND